MSQFMLEIVTPDRKFFEDEVEMVIARGVEGDIGIQYNHTPLITPLAVGKIKIKQDGQFREAAISEGYVEIFEDKTTIITDTAEWPEEIDVQRAKEAKERAEKRLKSKDKIDIVRAQVALQKALVRLDVANNRE